MVYPFLKTQLAWVWPPAFPDQVGRNANGNQSCTGKGVPEGTKKRIDGQKNGRQNKEDRNWISPRLIGRMIREFPAKYHDPQDGQPHEDPEAENDIRIKLFKGAAQAEKGGPNCQDNNRNMRCPVFRMNPGHGLKEDPIFGHGVKTGRSQEMTIHGSSHRQQDDEGDNGGPDWPDSCFHYIGGYPGRFSHPGSRENIEIGEIGHEVKKDN